MNTHENTINKMKTNKTAFYNLYLITQKENTDYDTFDGVVVFAPDEETARNMNPRTGKPMTDGDWEYPYNGWASDPKRVKVKFLGTAVPYSKKGIVLASFIAG